MLRQQPGDPRARCTQLHELGKRHRILDQQSQIGGALRHVLDQIQNTWKHRFGILRCADCSQHQRHEPVHALAPRRTQHAIRVALAQPLNALTCLARILVPVVLECSLGLHGVDVPFPDARQIGSRLDVAPRLRCCEHLLEMVVNLLHMAT